MRGHRESISEQLRQVLAAALDARELAHEHRLRSPFAQLLGLVFAQPSRAQHFRPTLFIDGHATDRLLEMLDEIPEAFANRPAAREHDAAAVTDRVVGAHGVGVGHGLAQEKPIELADRRPRVVAADAARGQLDDAARDWLAGPRARRRPPAHARAAGCEHPDGAPGPAWLRLQARRQQSRFGLALRQRRLHPLFEPLDSRDQLLMLRLRAFGEGREQRPHHAIGDATHECFMPARGVDGGGAAATDEFTRQLPIQPAILHR